MKKFFFAIAAMVLCLEIVPAAADLAELEKKFADSVVKVAFELKYDEKGVGTASITLFTTGEKMNLVFMGEKINVIAVVSSDVLVKICSALDCTMDDIVEIIPFDN